MDWKDMSESERRRWAFEKLDLARFCMGTYEDRPSDEDMFKKADRLVDYINDGLPAGEARTPASEQPADLPSSETPDLQPLEAI